MNKKIILYIDTSDREKASVKLEKEGKVFRLEDKRGKMKSQVTLELIDEVVKKARIRLSDIDTIKVKRGPGSYTGLRVGVSIANTLAFCLGKQVNDKKLSVIEEVKYE